MIWSDINGKTYDDGLSVDFFAIVWEPVLKELAK